jgi:hypothetical protein
MKSFRDDLIDRMKTGWGRFVLASYLAGRERNIIIIKINKQHSIGLREHHG